MGFDCIEVLEQHLNKLSNSDKDTERKKAGKLNYWVKDYIKFLENENKVPSYKYKRGSIVKAHLGFRIGHEHGGLHYCLVINSKYYFNTGLLTVVPLTSINNPSKKIHHTNVYLGTELKSTLLDKLEESIKSDSAKISEIDYIAKTFLEFDRITSNKSTEDLIKFFKEITNESNTTILLANQKMKIDKDHLDSIRNKLAVELDLKEMDFAELWFHFDGIKFFSYTENVVKVANNSSEEFQKNSDICNDHISKIQKMKNSSMALVDQITTISSVRVYDPISIYCSLNDIKMSNDTLDKIDAKIQELFIKTEKISE